MKLKSIAAIFKRNKRLIIYNKGMDENRSGTQWISNGVAMYAISGMSILTPENVLTIFDVTPEAKSDWKCTTEELPNFVSLEDDTESESDLEPGKINIEWFGKNYWLFPCGNKIYSVQANYIQP
ncbi:MAG: hypothetical protein LBU77_05475, partial [Clostridiales bacterium]|nr:hypothetical protein [Clostridiales bacterium]